MVRRKNRYLLTEIISRRGINNLTSKKVQDLIRQHITNQFGDFGSAAVTTSLQVKYFNGDTQMFILKCDREFFRIAWAAMTMITRLENNPVTFRVMHVSGTIIKCEKKLLDYQKENIQIISKMQQDHTSDQLNFMDM
eukprot:TRINITY_DN12326_c0_g1_i1.p1 TRINITY_DN12326_c0_g1~~TRINITY_DN12326_c0_g1_i1.p1  ORF type:complete len:137 (+),score=25.45 TRINITY_DN12326_c0_g1_i1:91-501(+)